MVFELYGCPGCGKTTITVKTLSMLSEKGYKCVDYRQLFLNRNSAFSRYMAYISAALKPRYFPLTLSIFKATSAFGCHPNYALYLITICQRIIEYEKDAENTIILLEEGVIQFVTSLAHEKPVDEYERIADVIERMKEYGIRIKPVDCILPLDENIKRLTERRIHSRFLDVKNETELEELLSVKRKNLDFVSAFFDPILTLDMKKIPEENADILCRTILSFVGGQ